VNFSDKQNGDAAGRYLAMLGGLIMACATMANEHASPHTVFHSEWFAAFGSLLVGYALLGQTSVRIRLGSFALVATLLLFASLLHATGVGANSGAPLYLALFLLCYGIGQQREPVALGPWIAKGMLLCALLQSLASVAQLAGWSLGGLIMPKIYQQAFGNIGQANHYTDLIFLGLASLCYLRVVYALGFAVFAGLAAWLCLSGAASASRGAWLYTAAFLVLGIWGLWRSRELAVRRGALALLVVAGLSILAQLLVSYGDLLAVFGITSSLARASDAGSNGQRLYDWHAAWLAIQASPWWGEGPGSFYKLSIDAMAKTGRRISRNLLSMPTTCPYNSLPNMACRSLCSPWAACSAGTSNTCCASPAR
jgi:O-antigen ligase